MKWSPEFLKLIDHVATCVAMKNEAGCINTLKKTGAIVEKYPGAIEAIWPEHLTPERERVLLHIGITRHGKWNMEVM